MKQLSLIVIVISALIILVGCAHTQTADRKAASVNDGFGVGLEHFLYENPCEYVEKCKIPAISEFDRIIAQQKSLRISRIAIFQGVAQPYFEHVKSLDKIVKENGRPGSKFDEVYNEIGQKLLNKIEQQLAKDIQFLNDDGQLDQTLLETKEIVIEWTKRIEAAADPKSKEALSERFVREYVSLYKQLKRTNELLGYVHDTYLPGENKYIGFESKILVSLKLLNKLQHDAKCDSFGLGASAFRSTLYANITGDLSLINDWKVVRFILNGNEKVEQPLTVRCPKVKGRLHMKYDPETHSLLNEWKIASRLCFPGSCGDLDFHINHFNVHAGYDREVIKLMRDLAEAK